MRELDRLLWRAVDTVILLAILSMVCLIALQVGSRLISTSVPWTEELSRFLFIWTIWLGLAASFRAGAHPSLDILSESASRPLRLFLSVIQVGATLVLFSAVAWFGFKLMRQQVTFGEQSAILKIGMWWTTLPLVLGATLSVAGTLIDGISRCYQTSSPEDSTARTKEQPK